MTNCPSAAGCPFQRQPVPARYSKVIAPRNCASSDVHFSLLVAGFTGPLKSVACTFLISVLAWTCEKASVLSMQLLKKGKVVQFAL